MALICSSNRNLLEGVYFDIHLEFPIVHRYPIESFAIPPTVSLFSKKERHRKWLFTDYAWHGFPFVLYCLRPVLPKGGFFPLAIHGQFSLERERSLPRGLKYDFFLPIHALHLADGNRVSPCCGGGDL
jgi:hypothetical protein